MIDVVVYFESKIVKVFLFNLLEESSHQNEKWIYRVTQWMLQQRLWFDHQGYSIYPSLDINSNLTKLYKFLTTLLKFWVKRCTTLRQKNLVNWVNFGTQTNPFGFHCIETLVSSNLNFFFIFKQERIVRGELYPNYQEALAFLGKAKEALRFASYVLDMMERKIPPEPDPQPKKRKKDQPKKHGV